MPEIELITPASINAKKRFNVKALKSKPVNASMRMEVTEMEYP